MRKRNFSPTVDRCEDRISLSSAPKFFNGAVVLTSRAYTQSVQNINNAFTTFARKGMNYGRLNSSLGGAIKNIPFHRVDGLDDTMRAIVGQMQSDIFTGFPRPVITAMQTAQQALHDDVLARMQDGSVVLF